MILEYKLLAGFGVFTLLALIGTGLLMTTQTQTITTPDQVVLSGTLLPLNPSRAMAGAPCHKMGGGWMGDCQVREVSLEAWRYDWSEPTITVKSGELIRIQATSRDVTHGIAIPAAQFNLVIEPGKTSVGEFTAPAPGTYDYGCSVLCGPGHHGHAGKLVVI